MTKQRIKEILKQGEGISVEFKKSQFDLPKNIFDSVCAMLNRNGGHILLGINDNGKVEGVLKDSINRIINNFVTSIINSQVLFPTIYLLPEIIKIDDKTIIYIYIPQSSQVHNTKGKIFDRNEDGDFDITNNSLHIANLYFRKQTNYSENTIYPYAQITDLRDDLIERARKRAKIENMGNHPWTEMSNMELLKSTQLYKKDMQTGKEGFTLAAILLFGKDETISNVLPYHKTDAILRRKNIDRYDDRDDIQTNLIESYDRLMAFVAKHLPDPFFLEGDTRISLRDKIFREAVTNILVHREYTNAFPAKMIIENDRVLFENANNPHGNGLINPNNYTPFPKNPVIAKVFKEIGFADILGSGVRNLFKYTKHFSNGGVPQLIEGDIFKIVVPTPKVDKTNGALNEALN